MTRAPAWRTPDRPAMSATLSGRVPPHDLDAELAVLAALLLDPTTLDQVQELLKPEHFYAPAHSRIYEACLALAQEGTAFDLTTVGSWLRSRERLADVGGVPYLAKITDATPEVANIEVYARIVREKWRVRELIKTCQRIAAEGYGDVGQVQTFIDNAEQAIYDLARTPESSTVSHLSDVIRNVFTKLEEICQRGSAITGFPTGFKKLDELTSGLHPTDLVIVAARPGMGKTSFVLNVAINVAQPLVIGNDPAGYDTYEQPGGACVIFSLEMPREQIASRILSSEARVDVQKIRGGRLHTEDWHNLTQAASFLSSLPIYIDDTPGITVLDVRSKVRRIQAELQRSAQTVGYERKVGLVVIDYLQLMRGSEKAGSREQEISEISRGLKHLAKELRVPVVALSQLNRSVETRSEKSRRPQISDLRECVTGDTLVYLADGRRVPIRELVGQTPEVLSLDTWGRVVPARAELVWEVGPRPVFEIRFASGRRLRTTGLHRLYGKSGWIRVNELKVGDLLVGLQRLPEPPSACSWSEDHLILLGHLVGNGSYANHQPLRYTAASEQNGEVVARAAQHLGVEVTRYPGRGNWHQLVFCENGNRWHPAGVKRWLLDLGIYGQKPEEKRIPAEVFTLDNRSVATLLQHLWAAAGRIVPRAPGSKNSHRVSFTTRSEGLAGDVAALLLRFGVVARLRTIRAGKGYPRHCVDVVGADAQRTFLTQIGAFGLLHAPAAVLAGLLGHTVVTSRMDAQLVSVRAPIQQRLRWRGSTVQDVSGAYGESLSTRSNRTTRIRSDETEKIMDNGDLPLAGNQDIFWDRVAEVRYGGEATVFDMSVNSLESWIGEGIWNHNSGAIEQDADLIMFIYRDDYYNKETAHKGIAEIIVAKQRNGPTGKALLRWDSACTRFVDLEPGEIPEGIGDE
ncbi:MAG: replicative DNA helicase [Myxococcales bacterium]|nr:replicative DNA helicase [Polyangiaceae bacterium]MDW8248865.1 replicative DNA helicase [Myxococcales bacterium]